MTRLRHPRVGFGLAGIVIADVLLLLVGAAADAITLVNALGGFAVAILLLPSGTFDLGSLAARLRGVALVLGAAAAWWVLALVVTSLLAQVTTQDAAGSVGAAILALGCFPLGLIGGLALTSTMTPSPAVLSEGYPASRARPDDDERRS